MSKQRSFRSGILGVLILVLIAGAIALDHTKPSHARKPPLSPVISPGGILACPFVSAGNGKAWMHFANSGFVASKVTVTTVREKGPPSFKSFNVDPGHAQTMQFDSSGQPAGAIVDFAGGEVTASRTSSFSVGHWKGSGAAACMRTGERTLVVPSGSTLNSDTTVVLLNPGTSDALADMTFLSGGDETAPQSLKSIVLPSRTRMTIRVSDYVFDKKLVSTVVRVHAGILAVDGVESSINGISLIPGVALGSESAGVAPGDATSLVTDLVSYGEKDAILDGSLLTKDGATAFTGLTEDLPPSSPAQASPSVAKTPVVGEDLSVRAGSPFAAAFRWVVRLPNGRSDVGAAIMMEPARRMVAVTGEPAGGGQSRILLGNPNDSSSIVRLTVLLPSGRSAGTFKDRILPAGGVESIPTGTISGPFGVLVEATQPVVMTLSSTVVTKDVLTFSVTGVPENIPPAVGVTEDRRLAVPAP